LAVAVVVKETLGAVSAVAPTRRRAL